MKPPLRKLLAAVLLAAFALAGCGSFARDKETAADAMDQFHDRLNAGEFDKIYDTADADLQRTTARADFLRFISTVHRKLGDYRTCQSQGWTTSTFNGDASVTLRYRTHFANGDGDEQFVFHVAGTRATLRGYHIASTALVGE